MSRVEMLADGSKVFHVNVGNMPSSQVDEFCQNIVRRVKNPKKPDEQVYVLPYRPGDEPNTNAVINSKHLHAIIALLACLVVLNILSFIW